LTASSADVNLRLISASALLDADPAAAVRVAAEILGSHPGNAAASLLLATAARNLGDTSAALEVLDGLAQAQPASGTIRLELARAYRAAGRGPETLLALRQALALEPALADGWRELSAQLAAAGDSLGADVAYARYVSLSPPPWHLADAAGALAENRIGAAESMLRRILRQAPKDLAAMRLLADALARREAYAEAEELLQQCLDLEPSFADARFDLARLLLTQQKPTRIVPLIQRLLLLDPDSVAYRSLLASLQSLLGEHTASIEIINGLLAGPNASPSLWMNLGHELKAVGRSADSIVAYRKSIELAPTNGAAYWSLADLKTFRFNAADLDAMHAALRREALAPDERINFEFALAKALEDESRFADSFEHYALGNSLRRARFPFDSARISTHVARSKELFTQRFFANRADFGSQSTDPIFVVGLPRAGSTLLEQILASHSLVEGTRELADIGAIARDIGVKNGEMNDALLFEVIEGLQASQVKAFAERYLDETRIYRHTDAPRFVDKMPNNFLYAGLIHLLFPRASIIDARRHPMAGCFSCYKQHFDLGQLFTNDLTDLGRYYRDYFDLMAHFDQVLPGRIHHVYYERVVADLNREVESLLAYCKLPFEAQCLRFYENARGVQTPSAEQVRRPIFSDGLDQWRNFEPWLGSLKAALGDMVERYPGLV
jgi:predicted Zn-dependent protease